MRPRGIAGRDGFVSAPQEQSPIEVSFVLPCLNEAETLERCILEVRECIERNALRAEIVVADNGSTDGSPELAKQLGARVVAVPERGYGSALMGGFDAARGRFLVMGDTDLSYDFREAIGLIARLRDGADLVMGSRFRGRIEPGAMPWLHRWLGNPVLSWLGRRLFGAPVSDFHCGLRALSRDAYRAMGLRTSGMEFASEIVVKAAVRRMRIEEVPVTLRPDARSRAPHLRRWRDGWRHLRFLLTLSPRWTLLIPGVVLAGLGALLMALVLSGAGSLLSVTLHVHTLVVGSLLVLVGYGAVTTALAMRIYALVEELGAPAPRLERSFSIFTLERGLLAGAALTAAGVALIGAQAWAWWQAGFGPLDVSRTLPPTVLGATLAAVGIQTVLASFVYSMLGIPRRRSPGAR
jgi:glycosyltransferase involved in cell wall biosynthesis